jgi:hypothetical protein
VRLGFAHFKSSAVDHVVRSAEFGGKITLWCDWIGEGLVVFGKEPRIKGRVCVDCQEHQRRAATPLIEHEPGDSGCFIEGGHTYEAHRSTQALPF